jgi:uncharacterized protein YlbG (UPF0298 family)
MSKLYTVQICRVSYSFATVEVEADSMDEAKDKALDDAGDLFYSEKDADYSVEYIQEETKHD